MCSAEFSWLLLQNVQLNDQASPGAQEGGRPEEGKHTGEWLVCESAVGEATPSASQSAEAAASASAEQTARWKSASERGDVAGGKSTAAASGGDATAVAPSGGDGISGGEAEQHKKRPLEGARERALGKLSKR